MKQILALLLAFLAATALQAQEAYKEHYADGKLKTAGFINKDTGKRQGHWVTYRQDGTKFEEFDYKNGEKEGKYYVYDKKGRIYIMETYHNGMLHGTMLQYYSTPDNKGRLPLYARTTYRNGEPVGTKYTYDRNGAIIKKRTFDNGMMASETVYDGNTVYNTSRKHDADASDPDDEYYYETIETARTMPGHARGNVKQHGSAKAANRKRQTQFYGNKIYKKAKNRQAKKYPNLTKLHKNRKYTQTRKERKAKSRQRRYHNGRIKKRNHLAETNKTTQKPIPVNKTIINFYYTKINCNTHLPTSFVGRNHPPHTIFSYQKCTEKTYFLLKV